MMSVVFAVLGIGCGGSSAVEQGGATAGLDSPIQLESDAEFDGTGTVGSADAAADELVSDLVVFVASIGEAISGTEYSGSELTDPEVFVAIGQLFCENLDAGMSVSESLAGYLAAIEQADPHRPSDDDAYVTGIVMGVAIETLCSQHSAAT